MTPPHGPARHAATTPTATRVAHPAGPVHP
ncbi:hypothetical protein DC74_3667 [Streptomyces noursei]|nr:hypothetical protein DC74_3667 [Streptomyces noursei]